MVAQSEAVNWLNSIVGQHLDYDKLYGQQCTDCFNFYYQFCTGDNPYADGYSVPGAKDLWNVANDRFTKIPDSSTLVPQPGDVAVYGAAWGGGYGHVEMVVETDADGCTFIGENEHGNPSEGVVRVHRTWTQMRGLIGVMRPNWYTPPPAPPVPEPVVEPIPAPAPPVPVVPSVITSPPPTSIKTAEKYILLTTLKTYASPGDAMTDTNPVSSLDAGTYIVFSKGGDSEKAYNLTSDNMKDMQQWVNILDNIAPPPHVETEAEVRATYKPLLPSNTAVMCKVTKTFMVTDRLNRGESFTISSLHANGQPNTIPIHATFEQGGRDWALIRVNDDPQETGQPLWFYGVPISKAMPGAILSPYLQPIESSTETLRYYFDKAVTSLEGIFRRKKR